MTDLFADIGWLEFQSKYLSLCMDFLYTVVCIVWCGVLSALSVQGRNASFIFRTLHSELYMVIHIIYRVEQEVNLVIFSYAYYIIHISLLPWCGDRAL